MKVYKHFVVNSFILIFIIIFFSCKKENEKRRQPVIKNKKEVLQKINKSLVDKDTEVIKSYIDRHGWDMKVSETGLWYMIYKEGTGDKIKQGDQIEMNYRVWLIDGTLVYSSDSLGAKSFAVGKSGFESGLEEGVLMLKKGSKARFILPPHLAYGLIGDENKIPARAIIIYDVEVIKIEE